jgi:transcriptional regulator with XRE-family HTH domain
MNTHSSLIAEMKDKEYRDAYITSQIAIGLPFQARALRASKGWTQEQLAEKAGMSQPRIAEIEKPRKRRFNLETLLRIASVFDVGLAVRFVPFGNIIGYDESFDPNSFRVPTFEEELAAAEEQEKAELERTKLARLATERISSVHPEPGVSPRSWQVIEGSGSEHQTNLDFMRANRTLAVNNQLSKHAASSMHAAAGVEPQWAPAAGTR